MAKRRAAVAAAIAITCLTVSEPSRAQEFPRRSEWAGSYWGLTGGGAWGSLRTSQGERDVVWTGFTGYGLQLSNLYVGAEVDVSHGGARIPAWASSTTTINRQVDWSLSGRARVGLALDGLLLYATAGIAWARQQYDLSDIIGNSATTSEFVRGSVVGLGLETKLLPFAYGRLEVLHFDYTMGDSSIGKTITKSATSISSSNVAADDLVVRAGLVMRLN